MDGTFSSQLAINDVWLLSVIHAERAIEMHSAEDGKVVMITTERPIFDMWTQALRETGRPFEVIQPAPRLDNAA
jgi:hypothetical protein